MNSNVKKTLLLFFTICIILINDIIVVAQPNNEWNNKPDVFQVNRLPATCDFDTI